MRPLTYTPQSRNRLLAHGRHESYTSHPLLWSAGKNEDNLSFASMSTVHKALDKFFHSHGHVSMMPKFLCPAHTLHLSCRPVYPNYSGGLLHWLTKNQHFQNWIYDLFFSFSTFVVDRITLQLLFNLQSTEISVSQQLPIESPNLSLKCLLTVTLFFTPKPHKYMSDAVMNIQ